MDEFNETLEGLASELLPEENAEPLTRDELLSDNTFAAILSEPDTHLRKRLLNECREQAKRMKCKKSFDELFSSYKKRIMEIEGTSTGNNRSHFPPGKPSINTGKWTADDQGVRLMRVAANGDDIEEWASDIPIMPTAILTNADTANEKIELSFYKDEHWQSAVFDRSVVNSSTKIVSTSDLGTEVNSENARMLVKYIADCVKANADTISRRMSVSHFGWHDNGFIPFSESVVFDGEQDYKPIFDSMTVCGELDEWTKYVRKLRENIYLRLMMGASFASPLLSIIGALPFVLHLWGGTEAGKTVGLMAAMSIWGDPSMGKMVRTMNMTLNSTMATAATLCDLPFAGDELQIIRERGGNYDTLIMSICEGVDRGRMSYNKVNEMRQWHCAFLFTGEEPVTRSSSGGGAKNRVIEIECLSRVVNNGKETANFLRRHYGHAGRRFIEYIKDIDLASAYSNYVGKLEGIDCTDKQRLSMAAIMLGDAIGSACLFPGEKPLAVDEVQPFLKTRAEVDTAERAFEFIKNVIAANDIKFRPNSYGDMRGEVWGRIETEVTESGKETARVYFNKNQLTKVLRDEGYEFDAIKAKWAVRGGLTKNSQGKMVHQTKCHGVKGTYVLLNLGEQEETG